MDGSEWTAEDLRQLRLRLIIDQAERFEAGELRLADLAHGVSTLISALGDENKDDAAVRCLQPISGAIEVINAVCLDEGRQPTPDEHRQLRDDVSALRKAASARL